MTPAPWDLGFKMKTGGFIRCETCGVPVANSPDFRDDDGDCTKCQNSDQKAEES